MTGLIAFIIVLSAVIAFLLFLVIRSVLSPIKIDKLGNLLRQGKYQSVIKAAKSLITKQPRNAVAHYILGQAYLLDNKPELALMEFKTINQIGLFGPDLPESDFRKRMAQLFVRFGQTEEGLKEYLLLTKLEPYQADFYYWAGFLFAERSRTDMAATYLRKAVDLEPRHAKAHYELAVILYREKRLIEAKAELEASLRFDSDNSQAYYYLGKILKENQDYVGALLAFERAQRDQALRVKALLERGGCYMSMNNVEKAIPELERAVKNATDEDAAETLYARYFLAACYEKLNDFDRAIEQWERIYARKPNFRDVGEKLAHYVELRVDDRMKDYLSSGKEAFVDICKAVVEQALSLQIRDITEISNGLDFIAIEGDAAKWRNVRKIPRLIRFLRIPELVDESTIRQLLEEIKKQNISRAVIITSSSFTRTAVEYADTRPVNLYDKDGLQKLLEACSPLQRSRRE